MLACTLLLVNIIDFDKFDPYIHLIQSIWRWKAKAFEPRKGLFLWQKFCAPADCTP